MRGKAVRRPGRGTGHWMVHLGEQVETELHLKRLRKRQSPAPSSPDTLIFMMAEQNSPKTPSTTEPKMSVNDMTPPPRQRTNWNRIAIIGAAALGLLIIAIPIFNRVFPAPQDPYEGGPSTPEEIRYDINEINTLVRLKCPNPGLSDSRWACPQVTQDQARLMIARSMTKHIEHHDSTLQDPQRYTQETREEITKAFFRAIRGMEYGKCTSNSHIRLTYDILTQLEQGNFIKGCKGGWNLTGPWIEVIARQTPPPTPDWTSYHRRLDTASDARLDILPPPPRPGIRAMKPSNDIKKGNKNILIVSAVILAVTMLVIAHCRWENKEQEKWDALYERGYVFSSEVGNKISRMDFQTRHRCARMGLTQEECPQSTGDTVRRLMATMMTQQAESHGPGPYGKGYAPEYAVAINHMFYQFIQSLEGFPCQPMLYRYASEKTLHVLQEGEFIHRCGKGWRINSEWTELMDRQ